MVDAKNRNMHKYKKTNLVLVLTVLITVLFQGFVKAEIIKWTNCKTIEDPFAESMWKMVQENQETKIPFNKEKFLELNHFSGGMVFAIENLIKFNTCPICSSEALINLGRKNTTNKSRSRAVNRFSLESRSTNPCSHC